jgi:hypothetical protein
MELTVKNYMLLIKFKIGLVSSDDKEKEVWCDEYNHILFLYKNEDLMHVHDIVGRNMFNMPIVGKLSILSFKVSNEDEFEQALVALEKFNKQEQQQDDGIFCHACHAMFPEECACGEMEED